MNEKNISKILIEIEKCEIFKSIVDSLDKQIPYPLAPITGVPHCGKCGKAMDLRQGDLNYCPNCGQRIRWGDKR